MKIIFMGTPEFAVPTLQSLADEGHVVAGVLTQPDRPAGRGNKIKASPVKVLAESLGLPVFQPQKIKTPEMVRIIRELEPECIVVVAYGQILSQEILDIPEYGCVNVHASLLPAYRGAAPIHWAVINGETKTGITTMLMDAGLDTGDMLLQQEYAIGTEATTGEVHDALAVIGARTLIDTLDRLQKRTLKPVPQPDGFTYAPLLKREHEQIDWSWPAQTIHNRIRGLNPWPGAFTFFRDEQIKLWKSKAVTSALPDNRQETAAPGEIAGQSDNGIIVRTGDGYLEIMELQPAGKNRMAAAAFYNGRRIKTGERFT